MTMPDIADDVDEHPIILNEWSINRILAGEKTQTRRIVKPQPDDIVDSIRHVKGRFWQANDMSSEADPVLWQERCPYGQPGDVLWVREAFRLPIGVDGQHTPKEYASSSGYDLGIPGRVRYEADETRAAEVAGHDTATSTEWGRKRPSIHMPRELCRIRLRVEDVRVERVQKISKKDVLCEGLNEKIVEPRHLSSPVYGKRGSFWDPTPQRAFREVWDDIHGDGAWERNDWVWVVSFSRINAK